MPMDTKKVLWTVLSVLIVLVVASGITLVLLSPGDAAGSAPASISGYAPPRTTSPDVYVKDLTPAPVPVPEEAPAQPGVIIIYGEKPEVAALPDMTGSTPAIEPLAAKPYVPAPATPAPTPAAVPKPAPAVAAPAPKPVAPKPAAAASATKPAAPKPAAPAVKTVTEFWIQSGSFASRANAEDLQRAMAEQGVSTIITMPSGMGQTVYRVRTGPFASKAEAESWLDRIRDSSKNEESYIVSISVQR